MGCLVCLFLLLCCAEIRAIGGFEGIRVILPVCEIYGRGKTEGLCGFVAFAVIVFEAESLVRQEANVIVGFLASIGACFLYVLDEVIVTRGKPVYVDLEERQEATDTVEVGEDVTASHAGAEIDTQTAIPLLCCSYLATVTTVMVGEVADGYLKALPILVDIVGDNVGVVIGVLGSGSAYIVVKPQGQDSIGDRGAKQDHITGENVRPYVVFGKAGILALLHRGHFPCFHSILLDVLPPFDEVGEDIIPIATYDDGNGGINHGLADGLATFPELHFLAVEVQKVTDGNKGLSAF